MKYFTAEEAVRIVNKTPFTLVSFYDSNPNLEAIRAVTERAESFRHATIFWGVACGFCLGLATGIRTERARRRKAKKNQPNEKAERVCQRTTAKEQ